MDYSVREVQLSILEVMKDVETICRENEIDYFIISGTVLGAIRHKGFIPWDDDLDIGMTRENYDKFKKVFSQEQPKGLFLQDYKSDPNIPFYFSKVRKDNTEFVENYTKDIKMHHGVYIDIFPYDNVPNSDLRRTMHRLHLDFWMNLFIAKSLKGSSVPQTSIIGKTKVGVRTMFHYLLKPVSKDFLFGRVDRISKKYNSQTTEELNYIKEKPMKKKRIDIQNLIEVDFENLKLRCHANPESYLEFEYGDYMALPKEENRVGHRPVKVRL